MQRSMAFGLSESFIGFDNANLRLVNSVNEPEAFIHVAYLLSFSQELLLNREIHWYQDSS